MKRLGLIVLAVLFAAACGGDSNQTQGETETPPAGKTVEVTFWHGFAAGANHDATNALVQKFNDAHTGKIKVTSVFAGNYDDTFAKIKTSITAGNTPQLVQIYEIRTMAQKLTKKDASGQTTQYGFGAAIYGWFLEQFAARADVEMCNNGNGRDKNATKLLSDSPQLVKVMDWWKQMVADGLALNTGRPTANMQTAFKAGRVAITLESTGFLGGAISGSRFQVGTGFYPRSESSTAGGPAVGGASLWIMNDHPAYEQRAAWEFVKFLETSENMAYWHTKTGYFPDTIKSQTDPVGAAYRASRPQFDTALQQLHQEKTDKATAGCILGVMAQARQENENAMEKILTGKNVDSKTALAGAVTAIQPAID